MSAWDEWIESEEGRKCVDSETLTPGPYLWNRLWHAFHAGAATIQPTRRKRRRQKEKRTRGEMMLRLEANYAAQGEDNG